MTARCLPLRQTAAVAVTGVGDDTPSTEDADVVVTAITTRAQREASDRANAITLVQTGTPSRPSHPNSTKVTGERAR